MKITSDNATKNTSATVRSAALAIMDIFKNLQQSGRPFSGSEVDCLVRARYPEITVSQGFEDIDTPAFSGKQTYYTIGNAFDAAIEPVKVTLPLRLEVLLDRLPEFLFVSDEDEHATPEDISELIRDVGECQMGALLHNLRRLQFLPINTSQEVILSIHNDTYTLARCCFNIYSYIDEDRTKALATQEQPPVFTLPSDIVNEFGDAESIRITFNSSIEDFFQTIVGVEGYRFKTRDITFAVLLDHLNYLETLALKFRTLRQT